MARSGNIVLENNFTRGLITEYTAMNFPENAVTDTDNTIYNELGEVRRRDGINYEPGYVVRSTTSLTPNTGVFVEFKWFSVGNSGTTNFLVQQIGSRIRFFAIGTNASVSGGMKSFFVDLTSFAVSGVTAANVAASPCFFTSGDGYLFVTNRLCDPFYVSYDGDTDTISTTQIDIKVRDTAGLDDGLEIDERPNTLSNEHKYNLYNQGWYGVTKTTSASQQNPLNFWDANRSDFPSNADIFWLFKNADQDMAIARVNQVHVGNTPAPKGHYIYDAFNIDRTAISGIPGLPVQSSGSARPSVCCWYAGRVWFAGTQSPKYSGTLFYSQLVEGEQQFGRCYQLNDPTSETQFDLVDTDGGTIELPLIEEIISMTVLGDSLIVLGSNVIYTITGSTDGPFRATNYIVKYLSPVGAVSAHSIVEAEGSLIWWNYDGIYALSVDQASFSIDNISKQTIQTFFEKILPLNVPYVKGAYNKREQTVRWIFSSANSEQSYRYDRALDLNLASKAFFPHTFDTTLSPRICGLISISGQGSFSYEENVTTGAGIVTNSSLVNVTVEVQTNVGEREVFKFATTGSIGVASVSAFTYSEIWDTSLRDWKAFNTVGVTYPSYGVSGYRVRGELLRSFNSTPIAFTVKYVEDGSVLVSGIWDYGFRQSSKHQLYLTRPEVSHLVRRIKLRGKGKSLQIKFESVADAPFYLIGWSTFDTGGTQP